MWDPKVWDPEALYEHARNQRPHRGSAAKDAGLSHPREQTRQEIGDGP